MADGLRETLIRSGAIVPAAGDADGVRRVEADGRYLALDEAGKRSAARSMRGEINDERQLARPSQSPWKER